MEVDRELGPGLLESVYQKCLQREFALHGLECQGLLINFNVPLLKEGIKRMVV
jgi:hypothetical protein